MTSKPLTEHERIERFIVIERSGSDEHFPWKLIFFDNESATLARFDGNVQVKAEGAIIRFAKARRDRQDDFDWDFHDLTLHPMGADTGPVDFQWMVTKDEIVLHDAGVGAARTFSYALSVRLQETAQQESIKLYFDPQLVNLGGSGELGT